MQVSRHDSRPPAQHSLTENTCIGSLMIRQCVLVVIVKCVVCGLGKGVGGGSGGGGAGRTQGH